MLAGTVTAALRDLYSAMDKGTGSSIPPFMLLQVMHIAFPRFAEKSPHGGYQQQVSAHLLELFSLYSNLTFSNIFSQDANECWTEILRMLQQKLPPKSGSGQSQRFT